MDRSDMADRIAYGAFLPLLASFLLLVGLGYYQTFTTVQPGLHPAIVLLETVAALAGIYVLARMSAMVSFQSRRLKRNQKWLKWLPWFAAFFLLSGYGVFSAIMLFIEGPVIIRENIESAIESLSKLQAVGEESLRVQEYDNVVARVLTQREQLRAEIFNPTQGNCGIGTYASQIISRIAFDLRGFSIIRGTDSNHNCNDLDGLGKIYAAYAKVIDEGLKNHPLASASDKNGRDKLLSTIKYQTKKDIEDMAILEGRLAGIANLMLDFDLYPASVRLLQVSSNNYAALRQHIVSYNPNADRLLQPRIDTSTLHNLVSGIRVINVVSSRLNRWQTYLYIALPFLLDLFMSKLIARVISRHRKISAQIKRMDEQLNVGGSDAVCLWSAAPPSIRTGDFDHQN